MCALSKPLDLEEAPRYIFNVLLPYIYIYTLYPRPPPPLAHPPGVPRTCHASEHVLLLTQPAVVSDVCGLRRLVDELFATYAGEGDDDPMQSADIAQFLCETAVDEHAQVVRAHWERMEDDRPFDQRLAWETRRPLDIEVEPTNFRFEFREFGHALP